MGPAVVWGQSSRVLLRVGTQRRAAQPSSWASNQSSPPQTKPGRFPREPHTTRQPICRCAGTIWDYSVSQLGRRTSAQWGPIEQHLGYGFANRPLDTVGIQYGLKALLTGRSRHSSSST